MTQEEEHTLRQFETRVRQLILSYNELEKENDKLRALVEKKDQALTVATAEKEKLRNDYANLKLAKMIEINSKELGNAKSRVAKLIREIDKCIALINL